MQTNPLIKDSQNAEHHLTSLVSESKKPKTIKGSGIALQSDLLNEANEMNLASTLVALNRQFLKSFAIHLRIHDRVYAIGCVFWRYARGTAWAWKIAVALNSS